MNTPAIETRELSVTGSLIHLSQLLGAPLVTQSGEAAGPVDDITVRLRGAGTYPLVTGITAGAESSITRLR
ncbi:hypothetical protein HMPREF0591_1720 [Mycobacterium parascrofulaceum ATCC BAA-614]|jgi:sporulation protein YlmC with PRC-barrel domain|uniref:PRC-barrel domain-containing protein n=1 Tax=Mycobacterium parascrofulaceum ATCC BAA-614 TaxID=525368 RepID=D5P6C6_9MYCO|nr:hypothetical protein HMPREF0591_1720 [Mycobacterium parascrofulaceum ATCC BAA-614]